MPKSDNPLRGETNTGSKYPLSEYRSEEGRVWYNMHKQMQTSSREMETKKTFNWKPEGKIHANQDKKIYIFC